MNELKIGKLLEENIFPRNYSDIVYLAIDIIPWNTNGDLIFRLLNDNTLISSNNTYRLNYWYELNEERYQYIFYSSLKIMIPNETFKCLFDNDLQEKLVCYQEINYLPKNIKQYKISKTIKHVENIFRNYLEINEKSENINENDDCYFFGVYNLEDLENIKSHLGFKHIIFGGSDLDNNMNHCNKIIPLLKELILKDRNIKLYFISKNLNERGVELGLRGVLVRLDLIENKWDNLKDSFDIVKKRNSIYCYTGCKRLGKLYNYDLLKEIESELLEYKFIYSHELNEVPDNMYKIYNKCFVGIRLTKKDGNANTVIEMGKLNIPIIFNGDEINSIPYVYDNKEDIINKIKSIKKLEI